VNTGFSLDGDREQQLKEKNLEEEPKEQGKVWGTRKGKKYQ